MNLKQIRAWEIAAYRYSERHPRSPLFANKPVAVQVCFERFATSADGGTYLRASTDPNHPLHAQVMEIKARAHHQAKSST